MAAELSPAQIAQVKESLKHAREGREICRKGQACGFDMAAQDAVIEALEARLNAVLANFGPNKRPDA